MNARKFTNLIIGNGEDGKFLAWYLAQSGQRTAVVAQYRHANQIADLAGRRDEFNVAVDFGLLRMQHDELKASGAELFIGRPRFAGYMTLDVRFPDGSMLALAGERIFLNLGANGRAPNTAGIGLEMAGIELDSDGYVQVNDRLETTSPNVWAIGHCASRPQFNYACLDDLQIICGNLANSHRPMDRPGRAIWSRGLDVEIGQPVAVG
jgi:thioredoxin reductase